MHCERRGPSTVGRVLSTRSNINISPHAYFRLARAPPHGVCYLSRSNAVFVCFGSTCAVIKRMLNTWDGSRLQGFFRVVSLLYKNRGPNLCGQHCLRVSTSRKPFRRPCCLFTTHGAEICSHQATCTQFSSYTRDQKEQLHRHPTPPAKCHVLHTTGCRARATHETEKVSAIRSHHQAHPVSVSRHITRLPFQILLSPNCQLLGSLSGSEKAERNRAAHTRARARALRHLTGGGPVLLRP